MLAGSMFAGTYLGLFLLAYVFFLDSSAIPSNPKRLGSATEMVFLSTRNRISVMQADAMKSSRCSAHPRGNSWEGRDTMIVLKTHRTGEGRGGCFNLMCWGFLPKVADLISHSEDMCWSIARKWTRETL